MDRIEADFLGSLSFPMLLWNHHILRRLITIDRRAPLRNDLEFLHLKFINDGLGDIRSGIYSKELMNIITKVGAC